MSRDRRYLNYDIRIERGQQGYRAEAESPAGQARGEFALTLSDLEIENFLLRIGHPRATVRGGTSTQIESAREFGAQLYGMLFDNEFDVGLRRSLDEAARQGAGLRIRLRLGDVPELADLPWEYLYHPALDRFLTLSVETPLVRYLDLPLRHPPLAVEPPLRILVMISSPSDYDALDVDREWSLLEGSLAPLVERGMVTLDRLDAATLSALQGRLRQRDFHVFHYIGHGEFDPREQSGRLILEDDRERGQAISGSELGTMLYDHRSLRLAVLNSCEGARASRTDPFGGVAQSLVRQGIPAVVAMQFEITDGAASIFARELYGALADGFPIDGALAEARKAIFASARDAEWGTPVLFMRSPNGQLFNIAALPARPTPRPVAESQPPAPAVVPPETRAPDPQPATVVDEVRPVPTPAPSPGPRVPLLGWIGGGLLLVALVALILFALRPGGDDRGAVLPPPEPTPGVTPEGDVEPEVIPVPSPDPTSEPTSEPTPEPTPDSGSTFAWRSTSPVDGMTQVFVPAGAFTMGSEEFEDTRPERRVTLAPFWIDRTEVTNGMYLGCVAGGACRPPSVTTSATTGLSYDDAQMADHPVTYVSWDDAAAYCAWAGRRLPTEAEWEKAARGADGGRYPWGNPEIHAANRLNFCDSNCPFDWRDVNADDGHADTAPVGSYPAGESPYGALDMAGNVWEWVADWYDPTYYTTAPATNPPGPASSPVNGRTHRGGAWDDIVRPSAARGVLGPAERFPFLGFRCARDP